MMPPASASGGALAHDVRRGLYSPALSAIVSVHVKPFISRHSLLRVLCAWSLSLAFSAASWGRAPGLVDTLRAARVTGYRVSAAASAAPCFRLDTAALRRRAVSGMADALRSLPGVQLRDYGGAGGLKTISVRGLGASHTLVSYDGFSVTDTQRGQADLSRFDLDGLSSLTLSVLDVPDLLVPAAQLGASLLALRSLRPDSLPRPLSGRCGLRAGSFDAYAGDFALRRRFSPRAGLTLNADASRAANDYPFAVVNGAATQHLRRANSRMAAARAEADLYCEGRAGRLEAKACYNHSHRRLPGQVILYVNDNNERLVEQTALAGLRHTWRRGAWQTLLTAQYDHLRSRYDNYDAQYPGGRQQYYYRQQSACLSGGAAWHASALPLSLACVTDYTRTHLRSRGSSPLVVSRDSWLTALSARWSPGRFSLTLRGVGHRHADHRADGGGADARRLSRVTPSVTAAWTALAARPTLRLRFGWKEHFRAPTFAESYYYHLGSATLRPERTRQLSGGLTLEHRGASGRCYLLVTADAYYNKVSDRIMSIPYTLYLWHTVNRADVRTCGLDLSAEGVWRMSRRHRLTLSSQHSLQRGRDLSEPGTGGYGLQPAYTPPNSGSAALAWDNPWCSAALRLTYAAERWATSAHVAGTRLPPWQEWGLSLWRALPLGARGIHRLTLRGDVTNLLDHRYEVVARYPMPGRAWRLSAEWQF